MRTENTEAGSAISRPERGLIQRISYLTSQAWFAYLTLFLLQLKIVWKAWVFRDQTGGDTANYYEFAWAWHERGMNHFAWSPLYTTFFGFIQGLCDDPISATLLHRLLIVFSASLLFLALMRKMVSPGIAWLTAAWWVVLPINFNTLYEVHLFATLPFLISCLLVATYRNAWGRGGALGVLVGSTLLLRNEMSVATALWAIACLGLEWRNYRSEPRTRWWQIARLAVAYGAPLALATIVSLYFYSHSIYKFSDHLSGFLKHKHTLNMAQVYSVGYQQRNPNWPDNPWSEYQTLMTEKFGEEPPSLSKMIKTNPRAVGEHFAWNYSLTPNGLQLLLFNATSLERNPDYIPVKTKSRTARVLTALLCGVWLAGLITAWRRPRDWWTHCVEGRGQIWLFMFCVACVTLIVIPTQRPRPSYLFALSITLMACTGSCIHLLLKRAPFPYQTGALLPFLAVGLIALVPSFYIPRTGVPETPLTDCLNTLRPYQKIISHPDAVFVKGEWPNEVTHYLGKGRHAHVYSYSYLKDWKEPEALDAYLTRRGVTMIYLDQNLLSSLRLTTDDRAKTFVEYGSQEWKLLSGSFQPGTEWRLFIRGSGVKAPSSVDLIAGALGSPAEVIGVATDGWTSDRLNFSLSRVSGANKAVVRGTVPLLDDAAFTTKAVMYVNNREVLSQELKPGDFELVAPLPKGEGPIRAEVRFDRLQSLPKGDGRRVSARVYSAATIARTD